MFRRWGVEGGSPLSQEGWWRRGQATQEPASPSCRS
jgi:hypothetical protein